MASKRNSESADPVIFTKLPRAEPAAGFLPGKTPGKPSPAAHPGSESHCSYKGSYFTCRLQSPEGPEPPPARWSPYRHHGPGAMSQLVPAEGPLLSFLLYPPDSLGARLQALNAHRSKDILSQEQLPAGKKPDSPRCPKPVAVNTAAPLAVPKPVYGAPPCFLAARTALPLQQRPGEANWALPPAARPDEPHKRGPCSERGLSPLPPGLALPPQEQLGSPAALPTYYITFDKYGPAPSAPFLEANCPSAQSQKKVLEVPNLSPDPWPKLQPPEAGLVSRERSAMCYPPPPYPLSPRRAGPLYSPAGEPGALPGFGYAMGEPFPGTYLRAHAPRSYFPSPLERFVPRAAGARAVASPPAQPGAALRNAEPPGDAELPRSRGYPGFAVSHGDAAVLHSSVPGTELGCEPHGEDGLQWRAVARRSSAFQPVCSAEKLSGGLAERFPKREGSWEKARQGEQEQPYPGRRNSSPAGGAGKGDSCTVKGPAEELARPSPPVTPTKGLEDPRDTKVLSSSPPMPVIHNVFSLAPYKEFLEMAKSTDTILLCRKHLWEESPPQKRGGCQEPAALRDASVVSCLRSGSEQSQGQSCYRNVPKKPKPEPQEPEGQEGSPDRMDSEELPPEDMVLDLSLKKTPVEAGENQGLLGCAEGTGDQEDKEEQKEATGGKVGLAEGVQPRLPALDSGDRGSFQSSATFMFQKYKLLPFLPPSTEPPRQDGSPQPPRPSPPSSAPTPTHPAPSPSSSPPVPGPQLGTVLAPSSPQTLLPQAPSTPGEEKVSVLRQLGAVPAQTPSGQYFTTLHTWLCDTISGSVSRSSPELLQQWLQKAEPSEELGEAPKSLPKPKNGSKVPNPQKATSGKEIWLAFQDVAVLLANLLSQLETFMFSCPFPHVVRAGAIFIPIHVVKEKLFPKLPGSFVDRVLQKHKVELRPTTLSEEKHLRDLELKSCTSRMLKLLALKQLPEIYPDLLNLHWHNSIRQQLGSPGVEALKAGSKATATDRSRKRRH